MNEREKLIGLLDNLFQVGVTRTLGEMADYLMDNGVVVLPCKVGDMVYSIEPRFYNYAKHEGVQRGFCEKFEMDKKGRWHAWVRLEYGEPSTMYAYNLSNFGKTVFLTREEAEAALKDKEG